MKNVSKKTVRTVDPKKVLGNIKVMVAGKIDPALAQLAQPKGTTPFQGR